MITLERCPPNRTCCSRFPIYLMRQLLEYIGGSNDTITFTKSMDISDNLYYSSPWATTNYDNYTKKVENGHVGLVDFHSDAASLAKYVTQSANVLRLRFSNIITHSEKWHTVGNSRTAKKISSNLSEELTRKCKLNHFQRFIFLTLKNFITASFNGLAFNSELFIPWLAMCITDKREERTLLCLKGRDSFMDCSNLKSS